MNILRTIRRHISWHRATRPLRKQGLTGLELRISEIRPSRPGKPLEYGLIHWYADPRAKGDHSPEELWDLIELLDRAKQDVRDRLAELTD